MASNGSTARSDADRASRLSRRRDRMPRPSLIMVTIAYVGIVMWLTLGLAPWAPTRITEVPFGVLNPETWVSVATWTTGSPAEFVFNVALFVPIGVISYRLLRTHARVLVPLALTVLIEVAQIPLTERVSDPRDLVANTLGAVAGLLLARTLAKRRTRLKSLVVGTHLERSSSAL